MSKLFNDTIDLNLHDADVTYYPNFLSEKVADSYFNIFKKSIDWQQDDIKVFGKVHPQPRLTALYSSNNKPYSYSNVTMHPKTFSPELLQLKKEIEALAQFEFTTCLLNLYRNGKDSNGWHADNEKELGQNPIIASVSLGADRFFHLKHNSKPIKLKLLLEHGSLLLMKGETQHYWKHQIPKTARDIGERINLTFRIIK